MRELISRLLAARGFATLEARTAEEAMALLSSTADIHVAIVDLQMPGLGGQWLVDQLRVWYPTVAVILATANDTVPGKLSLQPAVIGYLVKPIDGGQLADAVTLGLTWHQQQERQTRPRDARGDPIESWLDKKLTRGPDDSGS